MIWDRGVGSAARNQQGKDINEVQEMTQKVLYALGLPFDSGEAGTGEEVTALGSRFSFAEHNKQVRRGKSGVGPRCSAPEVKRQATIAALTRLPSGGFPSATLRRGCGFLLAFASPGARNAIENPSFRGCRAFTWHTTMPWAGLSLLRDRSLLGSGTATAFGTARERGKGYLSPPTILQQGKPT